jgi:hypothetical protein
MRSWILRKLLKKNKPPRNLLRRTLFYSYIK